MILTINDLRNVIHEDEWVSLNTENDHEYIYFGEFKHLLNTGGIIHKEVLQIQANNDESINLKIKL